MTEKDAQYDLVVLGGGPGGYPAAIKAAQEGLRVALVEAAELGGTCLNRGCIPSKALIACADVVKTVSHAEQFGVLVQGMKIDYALMRQHKDEIVKKMRKGLESLVAAHGVTVIKGYGRYRSPREIKVTGEDPQIFFAEKSIIATGSEPRRIPVFPCDHEVILDSTSLLEMKKLPKSLIVIGGGVIGCEFASLYHHLGVEVTVLELLPSIIPMEGKTVRDALTRAFKKRGIVVHTAVEVEKVERKGEKAKVSIKDGKTFEAERVLVSVGRRLNTRDIGLEHAGVQVDKNGSIPVTPYMETNVDGIYAIGDLTSSWWLAHVASHQGIVAAKNVVGKQTVMRYGAVPSVIFTDPEIGTVGLSLEKARESGYDAVDGAFPFQALGKSQASLHTEGFARIVIDRGTKQILGAQVVGLEAATLIAQMTQAIENELTADCIEETIHAHPTLSEAWLEAALLASGTPLHLPPTRSKKKKVAAK